MLSPSFLPVDALERQRNWHLGNTIIRLSGRHDDGLYIQLYQLPAPGFDAPMDKSELESLEGQIDELISRSQQLQDENQALREQQANLMAERASLIEKSELARSRVEAMIARLKAMEVGT